MRDFVERYSATPTLVLFRNRGHAELSGLEFEIHGSLPRGFAVTATAEASRGRDGEVGVALDDVAPPAVSMVVRHNVGTAVASYLRLKAIGSHDAAGPSEVPTGSYRIVDAGVSWRPARHWELRGSVRNLTNESYQSSAGPRWVWAPGRQGALTIVLAF